MYTAEASTRVVYIALELVSGSGVDVETMCRIETRARAHGS